MCHHARPRPRRRAAAAHRAARRTHRGGRDDRSRLGCCRPTSLRVGAVGLRTRRAARRRCPALGIAIGIASMVAVLGLSASSRAGLLRRARPPGHQPADRGAGQTLGGDDATLPRQRGAEVIARLGGVQQRRRRCARWTPRSGAATGSTPRRPAASRSTPPTRGCWRPSAARWSAGGSSTRRPPHTSAVVLGAAAARAAGRGPSRPLVYIAGRWWTVRRHHGAGGARARARPRGADRLRGRGARARRRAHREHRLPARRSVRRSARVQDAAAVGRQPEQPGGGRGQPSVGRARRARRRPTTR